MEESLRNFYASTILNQDKKLSEAWLIWTDLDALVKDYYDNPVDLGNKFLPVNLSDYSIYHENFSELFSRLPSEIQAFEAMGELVLWYLTIFKFRGESNLTLASLYANQTLIYKVNNSTGRRIVSGKRQFKEMIKTKRNVAPRCGAFALVREVWGKDFFSFKGATDKVVTLIGEIENALCEAFGTQSKHATGEPLALGNKNIWLKSPDELIRLNVEGACDPLLSQLLSSSWRMSALIDFGGTAEAVHKFIKSKANRP